MLSVSAQMGSSGEGAAAETHESSGGGAEESEKSCGGGGGGGGNRWPREETLALIGIRSEMDAAFRDSNLKAPLWEQVSRKMASLGFQRSGKKCKEKFENVYKYHKRTKEGRAAKSDGKTYRFFDELAAIEKSPLTPTSFPMASHATVSSISPTPLSVIHPKTINSPQFHQSQPSIPPQTHIFQLDSTSSSTSSDEDIQRRLRGKKRKWKDYLERLMKETVDKQEALQKKFLETLEKRERDRNAREDAWRAQETARVNREHEVLARERSMAVTKDAALIAFLQKVADQNNLQIPITTNPPPPKSNFPAKVMEASKTDGGGDNVLPGSSSRWPRPEIEALINLRTSLDLKYQDNGAKGPLWEEISAAMAKLGYIRSAKRCKEKWENINKYYKKVKETNKMRSEDSKTCPYFHQLEAIYKEKAKTMGPGLTHTLQDRPEQQWPLPDDNKHGDNESENNAELEDEEEEDGAGYELIADKQPSMVE